MKIAIASGKGGTGKTTLSVNLASYLAETRKVVLVDIDVEEPNSGLFIKGEIEHQEDKFTMIPKWEKKNCTLCGLCQEVCNFNSVIKLGDKIMIFPQLCHSCYACSELCPENSLPMVPDKMGVLNHFNVNNFTFIEGKLDVGKEQSVPLISQILAYVEQKYSDEYIKLYDSPPGTSCPVIEATKNSDFVILVTEPTPFGLHDLSLAVDTMRELKKDFGVVINRYNIGNNDVISFCENENIPIIAKLPNDRHVAELYSRGKLIYRDIPEIKDGLLKITKYINQLQDGNIA